MLVSDGAEIIADIKQHGTPLRSVLALLLLSIVAAVCASLGVWQLNRAAERDALHNAIERGRLQAPLALSASTRPADLIPWRTAVSQGRWSPRHTVLLENRNLNGRPGYWVATPLVLETSPAGSAAGKGPAEDAPAVLVLRGWLARDMQAIDTVPAIPHEEGLVEIQGELHSHVPRIFELWDWAGGKATHLPASLPQAGGAIPRVQNLDLADYAQATGLRLLPIVLAQTQGGTAAAPAGQPGGTAPSGRGADGGDPLQREWPGPSLDSDQNRGYALQWFSFSAIAILAALFVAYRLLRRSPGRSRQ